MGGIDVRCMLDSCNTNLLLISIRELQLVQNVAARVLMEATQRNILHPAGTSPTLYSFLGRLGASLFL